MAAKLYRRATEMKDSESTYNGKAESHRSLSIDAGTTMPFTGIP